jgi:class 3 adenylate cyclase
MASGGSGGSGRATATVLFTDLVGSTELRSRLSDQAAEELRRKHDRLLAEAVEAHQGRVVKGLGDGIMATFAGASDAVAAAIAMQQALERHNRSANAPGPLEIRVGLSAGDVTFEEADCFGMPVIEGSRLCAAAHGGQILASEIVRWLAGSGGGHRFIPVGGLELKGLPEAVPACEVAWDPLPLAAVPLPALPTDVGRIFVGRGREVELLAHLWKEAAADELRLVLIGGEPGVGKTRLAAELAGRAQAEGATVLAGRCDEDLGVPYQPFVEALRHFVTHTPAAELPARLGRHAGDLVRLVPELSEKVPGLPPVLRFDPETERYRLFDAVAAWLAAASVEQPVLLLLDDLQWAAKPTLLLLRHVSRSPESSRLLIVGTYRDTELAHDHPLTELLPDLRRQRGVERLSLAGLDQAGVAAYLEEAAGHQLGEEDLALARAVHSETEGNPFFVREVLRHLTETGGVERREGRWSTRLPVEELGIPEGVREVVGRRLSRLSAPANRALVVGAVAGAEFELRVLRAASGLDEEALVSSLEEAIGARLVAEVAGAAARYRFAHALVRSTIYDGLSAARRVALHRQVAEAIETVHAARLDDHLPALAHHYGRASAPADETAKAVEYTTRAGDRALAQLAHDEAVAYYRQALELLDVTQGPANEARRAEVLISLGEAQRRAGDPAHRETLLQAARQARAQGDAQALSRAALANTRGGMFSVIFRVDAERVAVLDDALAAIGPADSTLRARLLATLGQEIMWTPDRARRVALSDEALAMARRLGDPATLAEVLVARFYTIAAPSTSEERWANTGELLALAERLGDAATRSRALALRFRVAMERADVGEADRCLEANERLAAELHQPTLRWFVTLQRAGRTLTAGELVEGERLVFEAAKAGRAAGQPDAEALFFWQLVLLRFEQDRLGELVDPLAQNTGDYVRLGDLLEHGGALPGYRVMVSLAHWEAARPDEARTGFEALAGADFTDLPIDTLWLRTITLCAELCVELGDVVRAAVLYDMLAPYALLLPTFSLGTGAACVSHHLGRLATTLGRFDDADGRFAAAAAIHDRIAAPIWLARTRLEWARMLLTRRHPGDAERAQELLRQALATARELGLAKVERDAVALLQ